MLDLEALLKPVSAENPGGPDLEGSGDKSYTEIMDSLISRESAVRDNVMTSVEVKPPDWASLQKSCADFFAECKHLRIAVLLVVALLETDGFEGLFRGLTFLRRLVDSFWGSAHPLEPKRRRNVAFMDLVSVNRKSTVRLVLRIREHPLGGTSHSLAAWFQASSSEGEGGLTPQEIEDNLRSADPKRLALDEQAVSGALKEIEALDQFLSSRPEMEKCPMSWEPLTSELCAVRDLLLRCTPTAQPLTGASEQSPGMVHALPTNDADADANAMPAAPTPSAPAHPEGIRSVDDVEKALNQIIRYYETANLQSPIPLILARVKRLIRMNFLQLARELTDMKKLEVKLEERDADAE